MEVKSITKYARISPEKARQVARLIQGQSATKALAIVKLSPRKAAKLFEKTLTSAIANAENNNELERESLTVKMAVAGPGPMLKRFRPKARGMAGRIRKRTSHLTVILTNE